MTFPHSIPVYASSEELNSKGNRHYGTEDNLLADNNSEAGSDVSLLSDLSGLDDFKCASGPLAWIQQQMSNGVNPRQLLQKMFPGGSPVPLSLDNMMLWKIIAEIMCEPPKRKKLPNINTLDDVVHLLRTCNKVVVLTGAGVSVSCGIPDFRSRNGIYARLAVEYPDLPDPQAMFDLHYFKRNPRPFFKFAKEIYPGKFSPSPCHRFIKKLESHGKLLRNYTQNIDTLEQVAGIQRVIQCHGSFSTATCMLCKHHVDCEAIRDDIEAQRIPYCTKCTAHGENAAAVMKPDIVFFHENLSDEFYQQMESDKEECDLLIVIGSSLKVRPVAHIPNLIPHHVPQILINREPLRSTEFDVDLLGDGDIIVEELCRRLGSDWCEEGMPITMNQVLYEELLTPPASLQDEPCTSEEVSSTNNDNHNLTVSPGANDNGAKESDHVAKEASEKDNESSIYDAVKIPEESKCENSDVPRPQSDCTERLDTENQNLEIDANNISCNGELVNGKFHEVCEASEKFTGVQEKGLQTAHYQNLASLCPGNSFLFIGPSRYIFHGAEVYKNLDDSDDDDDEDGSVVDTGDDQDKDSDVESNENSGDTSIDENKYVTDSLGTEVPSCTKPSVTGSTRVVATDDSKQLAERSGENMIVTVALPLESTVE